MWFSNWLRREKLGKKGVVLVGWLLQTDHARFIWDAPTSRAARRSHPLPEHSKAVSYCPAVIDHESRVFEVPCPFDLRLRVGVKENGEATLSDCDGQKSGMLPRALANIIVGSSRNQWRHPERPIFQIRTPYTFLSDEQIYVTQMPPFMHYQTPSWPGLMIGGRMPAHIWPRPLSWAFEWYDIEKELVLKRGQPWFSVRFETLDPARHVRLVEAKLTPELKEYLNGVKGVVDYVNGTFSLFNTALKRRPRRLLVQAQAERCKTQNQVA